MMLAEPVHAELRGTDLRVQVADVARDAVVGLQRVEHVAAFDAAVETFTTGQRTPSPQMSVAVML